MFDLRGLIGGTDGNSGAVTGEQVMELQKALTMGYGTDVATLTGGGALRIQSLDTVMQATIVENKHMALFNRLPKPKVGGTVDEWTEQSGIGGFLGGATNSETGTIEEATGEYARRVGMVKYLMARRQVSFVATITHNIRDAEALEQANGALQLLSDANFLCYEGDAAVVPTEFDGIGPQLAAGVVDGKVPDDHVIDMRGTPLNSIHKISQAAQTIASFGNFGTPTDIFIPQSVQTDLDTSLDPAFRVPLTDVPGGGVQLGAPVVGIRTSFGNIRNTSDVFIREGDLLAPFNTRYASVATANAAMQPSAVTATPSSDAASQFTAQHAGLYYWGVAGVSAKGESGIRLTTQTTVAAGEKVTLSITHANGGETGFAIYRSRKNGTNAPADMRLVKRIPKGAGPTSFVDLNADIPGTTKAYMLNMAPSATAILWRQLLPMMKFPLFPTSSAVVPWAQLLFGYLRISKLRHHVFIKNILPNSATWKPFG